VTRPRWTLGLIGLGVAVGGLILVLATQPPAIQLPPTSAAPEVVLDTYLRTLIAGDCETGRRLGAGLFLTIHAGDLCGQTRVTSYHVSPGGPAYPNASEAVFAVQLTTTGSADGTVQPGGLAWFYSLDRQADGSWRISNGGSGP